MTISAKIIADSISSNKKRIITYVLKYPRYIHAEFMTHRVLSRNSASCLHGDTEIYTDLPSGQRKISDLYRNWNDNKNEIENMKLYCLDEETKEFGYTTIKNVTSSGIKKVYEIELDNGYKIKCTQDHRLFTECDHLFKTNNWQNLCSMGLYHNDEDPEKILWNYDHPKIATSSLDLNGKLFCKFLNIKNITYIGEEETFDIEVTGKFKNFVADGFVVHNSRAIPSSKFIADVIANPAMPVSWGKNCKGMQANEDLPQESQDKAKEIWLETRDMVIKNVEKLLELGLHKQIANRMLEPWFNITVLATGTEWDNFFKLRLHKDAQPEIYELAKQMEIAMNNSEPVYVPVDGWHIPFGDKCEGLTFEQKLKVAVARAARVSYNNFEGEIDFQKDFKLHDDLKESGHFSPFEHCAQALASKIRSGNFVGWAQYRKTISNESGSPLDE
jgi:hypothetical protein